MSAHFSCVLCEYATRPKHSRSCASSISRDPTESSVWECGSKDFPPILLRSPVLVLASVVDCFKSDDVTLLGFILKQTFTVYVSSATRRPPEFFFFVLLRHPPEEVARHPIVVKERFFPIFP